MTCTPAQGSTEERTAGHSLPAPRPISHQRQCQPAQCTCAHGWSQLLHCLTVAHGCQSCCLAHLAVSVCHEAQAGIEGRRAHIEQVLLSWIICVEGIHRPGMHEQVRHVRLVDLRCARVTGVPAIRGYSVAGESIARVAGPQRLPGHARLTRSWRKDVSGGR